MTRFSAAVKDTNLQKSKKNCMPVRTGPTFSSLKFLSRPIRCTDNKTLCNHCLSHVTSCKNEYKNGNRPRSIYQYSTMAPRLSGQTSIFVVVFFVSKSHLGIERQKKLEKFAILTRKPRSHVRILIYRTWPIKT